MHLIILMITTTNLGKESQSFFTLIQGKESPSQPSYDPGETQHISSLPARHILKVCFSHIYK